MREVSNRFIAIVSTDPSTHFDVMERLPRARAVIHLPAFSLLVDVSEELPRPIRYSLSRSRRRGVFERDMLGVSPLYYRAVRGGWACSSDLALLRRLNPRIDVVLKAHLVVELLNLGGLVDSWSTVWDGIFRVPPGASITLLPGASSPRRGERLDSVIDGWCEDDYTPARFLGMVRGAMTRAGHDDAPLALSSGVDSTLLAMLSRYGSRKNALVASVSFPGFPDADESDDVRVIANTLGKTLVQWDASSSRPASRQGLERLSRFVSDMPHMHPGAHYELGFERWLSETIGATHKVSGTIGDQLMEVPAYWVVRQLAMASTRSSISMRELRWWFTRAPGFVARHLLGASSLGRYRQMVHRREGPLTRFFPAWRGLVGEGMPMPDILAQGMARRSCVSRSSCASPLSSLLRSWRWESCMRELRAHRQKSVIQGVFPFLDEELWRWMLKAPPWILLGASDRNPNYLRDKRLARRAHALEGALPEVIAWRAKVTSLESFVRSSMIEEGYKTLESWSQDMALEDAGVLEHGATRMLLSRIKSRAPSTTSVWSPIAGLWSIFALERWVRGLSLYVR